MDTLSKATGTVVTQLGAQRNLPTNLPVPISKAADLPPRFDRETDRAIPDRVVCFHRGAGEELGVPVLRRPLSETEHQMLEHRSGELRRAVAPFEVRHSLVLEGAVSSMLGSGFAMTARATEEDSRLDAQAYLFAVRDQPPWAIIEACDLVRRGRAGIDRRFCPPEPAFAGVVAALVQEYVTALRRGEALLRAEVEPDRFQQGYRPTAEDVERILGCPAATAVAKPVTAPPGDGRHAERVRADLERRRVQRETAA